MSINKLFLISILINVCLLQEPPDTIEELTCGKEYPSKDTDCTKYGTGSEMLCCWVASSKESTTGKCFLIPQDLAESAGIDGEKYFDQQNQYFSCGNKSSYLNYNIIMILLVIFAFLK